MPAMTITTTAGQATRAAAAFGQKLNLSGNASEAQIKADVVAYIRAVVLSYENQVAISQLADTPFDPT